MGKVIVGMTMSLDGVVQDRQGSVGALYPDLDTLRDTEPIFASALSSNGCSYGKT